MKSKISIYKAAFVVLITLLILSFFMPITPIFLLVAVPIIVWKSTLYDAIKEKNETDI